MAANDADYSEYEARYMAAMRAQAAAQFAAEQAANEAAADGQSQAAQGGYAHSQSYGQGQRQSAYEEVPPTATTAAAASGANPAHFGRSSASFIEKGSAADAIYGAGYAAQDAAAPAAMAASSMPGTAAYAPENVHVQGGVTGKIGGFHVQATEDSFAERRHMAARARSANAGSIVLGTWAGDDESKAPAASAAAAPMQAPYGVEGDAPPAAATSRPTTSASSVPWATDDAGSAAPTRREGRARGKFAGAAMTDHISVTDTGRLSSADAKGVTGKVGGAAAAAAAPINYGATRSAAAQNAKRNQSAGLW